MPKSFTWTPSGHSRPASRLTTSTPNPSSPRNMLPIPAIRIRLLMGDLEVQRLDLLGGEKEPMSKEAVRSKVAARVLLERHRDVDPVLVILLYTLDERDLPLEREVHDVSSGTGPEQDPAPLLELDAAHEQAPERGPLLVLPEEVLHPSPAASGCPGRSRSVSSDPPARGTRTSPGSHAPAGRRHASPLSPR